MKKSEKAKPITTDEYFNLICRLLSGKGLMPDDLLDYRLAAHESVPIRTYEFNIRNNLEYGANEGIYLDIGIGYEEDGEQQIKRLGTFKTLRTDREAMRAMARLLADFLTEERDYVNSHLDDFTWTGMDVYVINTDGEKAGWTYTCPNMAAALRRKDELLKTHRRVAIRNNQTREMKIYNGEFSKNVDL